MAVTDGVLGTVTGRLGFAVARLWGIRLLAKLVTSIPTTNAMVKGIIIEKTRALVFIKFVYKRCAGLQICLVEDRVCNNK